MINLIRKALGFPKYHDISFEWIVVKDGRDLMEIYDYEFHDMFWEKVKVRSLVDDIDVHDHEFWLDCNFYVKHAVHNIKLNNVIIMARNDSDEIVVRGLIDRLPHDEWVKLQKEGLSY